MNPNLITFAGFICVINIMLMEFINAAPVNLITKIQFINNNNVANDMQLEENGPDMQMFANFKPNKEILPSTPQVVDEQEETTIISMPKISPRARPTDPEVSTASELTLSLPRFQKNKMGNWVYNPWGLTLGKVWQDTRFNFGGKITVLEIFVDSVLVKDYYPEKSKLSTVCVEQSTVYNKPPIVKWLSPHMYDFVHKSRKIMNNLRRNIYKLGNPEECHTINHLNFREFQECNLRRHQRLESLVPQYPRHQIPQTKN